MRKANQLNVSPEIATQMRMQEQRIRELEEQNTRIDFNNRVDRLQQEQGLTENQVVETKTVDAISGEAELLDSSENKEEESELEKRKNTLEKLLVTTNQCVSSRIC